MPGIVLLTLFLALGCGSGEPSGPDDAAPSVTPVAVSEILVTREAVVEPIVGTGTIAPHKKTELGPRVNGNIEEIFVRVGDRVEAGDPLFRTRSVDYEIRVKEAEAAERLAGAEVRNSERDLKRTEGLHSRGVASDSSLDDARTAHEILAARFGQSRAALARARQQLQDTLVRAPYRAVITKRYVDEGAMMSTMMSGSSPVLQIMKIDIVGAIVQIPEVHLPRVRVGTAARVRIDGTDSEYETTVYILNDRVDPVSRAFEVRLPIENPDYAVKPGLFAEATLFPEPRDVTLVDRSAVLRAHGSHYVFVERGGRAERRTVRVREHDAVRMEALDGLAPGDRVLSGPSLQGLRDGTPIVLKLAHADR